MEEPYSCSAAYSSSEEEEEEESEEEANVLCAAADFNTCFEADFCAAVVHAAAPLADKHEY